MQRERERERERQGVREGEGRWKRERERERDRVQTSLNVYTHLSCTVISLFLHGDRDPYEINWRFPSFRLKSLVSLLLSYSLHSFF